ncbi:hypothetical protein JHS3_01520 [Jeongeupia sp. HS-3]|uniref:hypothetical protein n=1 Tax=Jeongeupia sp. HS-3 TaxID=1009682 RepID=UPI0018A3E652|nr:hypothetical protein [Jeongeupia sp. HS-3]BCL74416.1 hypothetical protein JHS3_01520 [Jeongeupia sp. HS-3]
MSALKIVLFVALVLAAMAVALLAGVFFGKQWSDGDAGAQEARISALSRELAHSRVTIKTLETELIARAASSASSVSAADNAVQVASAVAIRVSAPERSAYRHFGNISCTLSSGDGTLEAGDCAVLKRIAASGPAIRQP